MKPDCEQEILKSTGVAQGKGKAFLQMSQVRLEFVKSLSIFDFSLDLQMGCRWPVSGPLNLGHVVVLKGNKVVKGAYAASYALASQL